MRKKVILCVCLGFIIVGLKNIAISKTTKESFLAGVETKKYKHEALEDGCDSCHEDNNYQETSEEVPTLCYDCHDKKEKEWHDPIVSGECLECHNPHASNYKKLINMEDIPEGISKINDNIAITLKCISCHDDKEEIVLQQLRKKF